MDNPELYVVNNSIQKRDALGVLKEFSGQLTWSEGEHVLDVGCGPGDITADILLPLFQNDVSSLVGLDKNPKMIKYAEENYSKEKIVYETLDYSSRDLCSKLSEKHFSKIFSFYCLHWIQDQRQMAANTFNLLKPGGEFLAVLVSKGELFLACEVISSLTQFKLYCKDVDKVLPPMHYSKSPSADMKRELREQGLEVIYCEERPNPVTYPSLEATTKSFEAINPYVIRMPKGVKEQYLDAFRDLIKIHSASSDNSTCILKSGEVQFTDKLLVVLARRPTYS